MKYLLLFLVACGSPQLEEPKAACEYIQELQDTCETDGGTWIEQTYRGNTWILFCDMNEEPILEECN